MVAALYHRTVLLPSSLILNLIDHRYFYDKFDDTDGRFVAYYTCGISRDAVSPMLLANKLLFGDSDFLRSLPDYINNASVAGYMIEQAVLASIAFNGLSIASR